MASQFVSSLAESALFVAACEMLKIAHEQARILDLGAHASGMAMLQLPVFATTAALGVGHGHVRNLRAHPAELARLPALAAADPSTVNKPLGEHPTLDRRLIAARATGDNPPMMPPRTPTLDPLIPRE